ncbi:hypothetical protein HPB47_014275, partial [Ixodes persulcatus]
SQADHAAQRAAGQADAACAPSNTRSSASSGTTTNSNLVTVFEELLSREAFVDVTLVCEGALFAENPCQHPVVIMNQTRQADLRAVVEFMYKGEINVAQDQLPTLPPDGRAAQGEGARRSDRQREPRARLSPTQRRKFQGVRPTRAGLTTPRRLNHSSSTHHQSSESHIPSQRAMPSRSSPQHHSPHTPPTHLSKRKHTPPPHRKHARPTPRRNLARAPPSQDAVALRARPPAADSSDHGGRPPRHAACPSSRRPLTAGRSTTHTLTTRPTGSRTIPIQTPSAPLRDRGGAATPSPYWLRRSCLEPPLPPDYGAMEFSDGSQGGTLMDEGTGVLRVASAYSPPRATSGGTC